MPTITPQAIKVGIAVIALLVPSAVEWGSFRAEMAAAEKRMDQHDAELQALFSAERQLMATENNQAVLLGQMDSKLDILVKGYDTAQGR